jgi:putative ABC transport system permease protein
MLTENVRIAFSGLLANKLRTLLSVLGILIGVMSVTILLSVGAGASAFVSKQVDQLGTNTLFVFNRDPSLLDPAAVRIRKPALTRRDVVALRGPELAPYLERVVAELSATLTVSAGKRSKIGPVTGSDATWTVINNRKVAQGLSFTDADVKRRARVAVIGPNVARDLFPNDAAIGRSIQLGNARYEVIGIFEKRGGGLLGDQDGGVLVPETAFQDTTIGAFETYNLITLQVRADAVKTAPAQIRKVLLREHGIKDEAKADFDFFDNAQLSTISGTITTVFSALLGLIAGISLLVGGIGVMNIMLVTVTERTREIGIRKALGAKRWHLLTQFLVESVVLTGLGGAIGAGIGAGLAQIKVGGFAPILRPWMLVLAMGVSAFIGVGFGVYPANKAAKLRPIDALRFE